MGTGITAENKVHSRQYPLVAMQPFELSQLTAGSATVAVKIPAGARVIGGGVMITEVFNSTTSDGLDIGDDGDDDRYTATAVNGQALGYTALTITGYKYTTTNTIDILWASGGGSPSTGEGLLIVQYVMDGRGNEVVPSYD